MPRLRLILLGAFHAALDGRPLTKFGSAKTQGLLAYLALAVDHPHSRAVLAAMFWPEEGDSAASHNLRQTIYDLRRLLDSTDPREGGRQPYLLVTRQTIQFNPASDYDLDVARFLDMLQSDRQEEAAALYRGDLLAGMIVDGTPFEEWQHYRREQLHRQAMNLLGQLAERYLQQQLFDKAQWHARRQLELEPWSEPAHWQLMRALWLAGERGAALAQFQVCRQVLAAELGVEPHVDTLWLAQQIREDIYSHDPASRPATKPTLQYNLPAPLTSIVGREAELRQVQELLAHDDCRLLTITGLGGIGKTRLALAAAHAQLNAGWHEVHFIALSPVAVVTSSETLAHNMIQALEKVKPNLHPQGQAASVTLSHLWHNRRVLLVLDNCEVILSGAEWLADLLMAAPGLKILAVSRHRLNLQAEWAIPLNPLSLIPEANAALPLSPGAQLFVQKARQARPQFQITGHNLPWINQICQLLDGLPLGLELAAARVRLYTTRQIAGQLTASASALSTDELDRPDRHRSLTAVFDSSLALLTPEEWQLFCRLAVFNSGFSIEAAQAITGAVPATIFRLLDRSLLRFDPASQRFLRHPLVYAYALEKLRESPEEEHAARAHHAAYYAAFLDQRRQALRGFEQATALREIEADLENILAAWHWLVEQQQLELLALISDPLHDYHVTRGLHQRGEQLFGQAAEAIRGSRQAPATPEPAIQAIACTLLSKKIYYLHARGQFAEVLEIGQQIEHLGAACPRAAVAMVNRWWGSALSRLGRPEQARPRLEYALALSEQIGDVYGQVEALRGLVHFWMGLGEYEQAGRLLDQAWALRAQVKARDEWLMLRLYGYLASAKRDYGRARDYYTQALACTQRIGDSFAQSLIEERLGEAYLEMGELDTARHFLEQSLVGFRNAGAGEYEALSLFHLGRTLTLTGQKELASQMFGEGLGLAQHLGNHQQAEEIQAALRSLTARDSITSMRQNHGLFQVSR
ncbi:MAG: BTAD domain-containing putative transcriptional regulator [Anaerolineae bacterium]